MKKRTQRARASVVKVSRFITSSNAGLEHRNKAICNPNFRYF